MKVVYRGKKPKISIHLPVGENRKSAWTKILNFQPNGTHDMDERDAELLVSKSEGQFQYVMSEDKNSSVEFFEKPKAEKKEKVKKMPVVEYVTDLTAAK